MKDRIEALRSEFAAAIAEVNTTEALENLRVAYLGKKGSVAELMKGLRDVEDKKAAGQLINELKTMTVGLDKCDIVLCVPYVDIATAVEAAKGTNIHIGAENVHFAESGAYTGEISAKMLCEYRSSDRECLAEMKAKFEKIFAEAKTDKVGVKVDLIGDRPCSNIEDEKLDGLRKMMSEVIMEVTGREVVFRSSSTDCNIPLSLGIPAICTGLYVGEGSHTREEWVEKASLVPGLEKAIKIMERIVEG